MVNVTLRAVRRPDGPRKGRNGAEVKVIPKDSGVSWPENTPYVIPHAPGPFPPYKFAFWSVVGAAKGPFIWFNEMVPFTTGTTDVLAKAWYVLEDPQPPSGTGVFVDAFLIDSGTFVDDDFVTVKDATNQVVDAQRTDDANVNGLVPTPSTASVDAAPMLGGASQWAWISVTGKEKFFAEVLTAEQDTTAEVISFYKAEPTSASPVHEVRGPFADRAWVSWGVTVDGGGPWGGGPPIPPWDPLLELAAGLSLAEVAQKLHPTLRTEALGLAARQVSLAGDAIAKAIESAAEQGER